MNAEASLSLNCDLKWGQGLWNWNQTSQFSSAEYHTNSSVEYHTKFQRNRPEMSKHKPTFYFFIFFLNKSPKWGSLHWI